MSQAKRAFGLLAGLLMVAGVLLLLLPVKVDGVKCGTAFSGDDTPLLSGQAIRDECADKQASRGTLVLVLLGVGAAAGIGAALVFRDPTPHAQESGQR
jgi:hypothetical protein